MKLFGQLCLIGLVLAVLFMVGWKVFWWIADSGQSSIEAAKEWHALLSEKSLTAEQEQRLRDLAGRRFREADDREGRERVKRLYEMKTGKKWR